MGARRCAATADAGAEPLSDTHAGANTNSYTHCNGHANHHALAVAHRDANEHRDGYRLAHIDHDTDAIANASAADTQPGSPDASGHEHGAATAHRIGRIGGPWTWANLRAAYCACSRHA